MRTIDADALKEYLENCDCCDNCKRRKFGCYDDCPFPDCLTEDWNRVIDEQPTVPRWIPCTERLPRIEDNPVLVSWMGLVNIGWYNPIDGWTTGTRFNVDEVDAWMPLPAPYKEGEE